MDGEETAASSKAAAPATIRLVNFISEEQLDEAKRTRGERADDGTAQRDKPLFQVSISSLPLLDSVCPRSTKPIVANAGVPAEQILQENKEKKDAEFNERFKHRPPKALDEDETEFLDQLSLSRREHEQQVANEEAEQLRSFHELVAAQSNIVHELETPTVSRPEESKPKPPTKRSQPALLKNIIISVKPQAKKAKVDTEDKPPDDTKGALGSLVAYDDDESGDDDD